MMQHKKVVSYLFLIIMLATIIRAEITHTENTQTECQEITYPCRYERVNQEMNDTYTGEITKEIVTQCTKTVCNHQILSENLWGKNSTGEWTTVNNLITVNKLNQDFMVNYQDEKETFSVRTEVGVYLEGKYYNITTLKKTYPKTEWNLTTQKTYNGIKYGVTLYNVEEELGKKITNVTLKILKGVGDAKGNELTTTGIKLNDKIMIGTYDLDINNITYNYDKEFVGITVNKINYKNGIIDLDPSFTLGTTKIVGDSYTKQNSNTSAEGTSISMLIQGESGFPMIMNYVPHIMFNITNVTGIGEVTDSHLLLYQSTDSLGANEYANVVIYRVIDLWNEATLKANQSAAYDNTVYYNRTMLNQTGWVRFNVTRLVNYQLQNGTLYNGSLALNMRMEYSDWCGTCSSESVTFYTKDYTTISYYRPNLTIQYIPGNLTRCLNLTNYGQYYYLQNNVSADSTCFNITAPNITLDCNGYSINLGNGTVTTGVYVTGVGNVTIKNCVIIQNNTGGTQTGYGIRGSSTQGITILNNTFLNLHRAKYGYYGSGYFTNVNGNTFAGTGYISSPVYAIYLTSVAGGLISGNYVNVSNIYPLIVGSVGMTTGNNNVTTITNNVLISTLQSIVISSLTGNLNITNNLFNITTAGRVITFTSPTYQLRLHSNDNNTFNSRRLNFTTDLKDMILYNKYYNSDHVFYYNITNYVCNNCTYYGGVSLSLAFNMTLNGSTLINNMTMPYQTGSIVVSSTITNSTLNNTGTNNLYVAYIFGVENMTLSNNVMGSRSASNYIVYLSSNWSKVFIVNNNITGYTPILASGCTNCKNSVIKDNNIINTGSTSAISMSTTYDTQLNNNTIYQYGTGSAITLSSSRNMSVNGGSIIANGTMGNCISLTTGTNNTNISNIYCNSTYSSIVLSGASQINTTIIDCELVTPRNTSQINISCATTNANCSAVIIGTNITTERPPNIIPNTNAWVEVWYYLRPRVLNNSIATAGANVTMTNTTGHNFSSQITDTNGNVTRVTIRAYTRNYTMVNETAMITYNITLAGAIGQLETRNISKIGNDYKTFDLSPATAYILGTCVEGADCIVQCSDNVAVNSVTNLGNYDLYVNGCGGSFSINNNLYTGKAIIDKCCLILKAKGKTWYYRK